MFKTHVVAAPPWVRTFSHRLLVTLDVQGTLKASLQ